MTERGHVLIVGASSGIGHALAERLAAHHSVSALARRADRLATLEPLGVRTYQADVADLEQLPAVLQKVVEDQGALTAVIYCAGVQSIKPIRSVSPAEIAKVYTVNLIAPTVIAGQFASRRIAADNAVFCVVSSIAAQRPEAGIVTYGASKAGLDSLVRGLARELGPKRVVGVAPGWLDTEMTQAYSHLYNDAFRERLAKQTPGTPATVDGVVDTVLFLLSPSAASITGEIIRVDGGAAL